MPKPTSEKPFNDHAHKPGVVDFCCHKELKHFILTENFPANSPIKHSQKNVDKAAVTRHAGIDRCRGLCGSEFPLQL